MKTLSLSKRIPYPIRVSKIYKPAGDRVAKQDRLFEYTYTLDGPDGANAEAGGAAAAATGPGAENSDKNNKTNTAKTTAKTTAKHAAATATTTATDSDDDRDHVDNETNRTRRGTRFEIWHSPAEGLLKEWRISEGQRIDRACAVLIIEEPCSHEVQFAGLCAFCGADMTWKGWESEQADTGRATINMSHDQTALMVSGNLAAQTEHNTQRRLLQQRKLSLVVDLDQTIIHACIDPTVAEWKADPASPNHGAVRDVAVFQLSDEAPAAGPAGSRAPRPAGPRGMVSGCSYYIKVRPGCQEFLEQIARRYELHIYTMATRAYALHIARIVDPDRRLFGNRVISRDENGTIVSKSLQRLFPVSTNMVVIIDDRSDMWPRNRQNLIKVVPFDFFKGIGDINSSFLPKRQDVLAAAAPPPSGQSAGGSAPAPAPVNGGPRTESSDRGDGREEGGGGKRGGGGGESVDQDQEQEQEQEKEQEQGQEQERDGGNEGADPTAAADRLSALEDLIKLGGADDKALHQIRTQEQERSLEKQITERPLQHLQEELDKQQTSEPSERLSNGEAASQTATSSSQPTQPRRLLDNDDDELIHLQRHLTQLHTRYYEEYDRACAAARRAGTGPVGRSGSGGASDVVDASLAPDVGLVLSRLKSDVFSGLTIALSGLVPLGTDVLQSEIGMQTASFGASIRRHISPQVTHLIVSTARPRTEKVQQAARMPRIKIVNQSWLVDCMSQWRRLDETPYLVETDPADVADGTVRRSREEEDEIEHEDGEEEGRPTAVPAAAASHWEETSDNEDEEEDQRLMLELKKLMPDDIPEGQKSPIDDLRSFDWGSVDEELAEFLSTDDELGDDDTDDDDKDEDEKTGGRREKDEDSDYQPSEDAETTDSGRDRKRKKERERDDTDPAARAGVKRKAADDSDHDSTESGSDGLGNSSAISRKRRVAQTRASAVIKGTATAAAAAGAAASQATTKEDDEMEETQPAGGADQDDDDVDLDQLEADLIAELEAADENG